MPKNLSGLFSESDMARVTAAVRQAESGTSGEIVPYAIAASDFYSETVWRAVAIAMGVVLVALGGISLLADTWMKIGIAWTGIIALGAGIIVGVLFALLPPLRRAAASDHMITRRVTQRAAQAFLAEEIFRTRDRVGVLIFLSILERRVIVLGDSGINAHVGQAEWDGIVATIVAAIRARKPADGLVAAIAACGTLLRDHGFVTAPDDVNELPDELR